MLKLLFEIITIKMSYISVSDLLDYITPDADLKAREAQRKARAKVINDFILSRIFLFLLIFSLLLLIFFY